MSVMGELLISVVGGVLTALVMEIMGRGRRDGAQTQASVPAPGARGESILGGLLRVLIAIAGGLAIATFAGRMLVQAGIMPRGQGGRLILLVAGTALIWLLLSAGRRR